RKSVKKYSGYSSLAKSAQQTYYSGFQFSYRQNKKPPTRCVGRAGRAPPTNFSVFILLMSSYLQMI
ncbi:MAG: hypothetical protein ACK5NP_14220, partial [Pseudanabaena sp.]